MAPLHCKFLEARNTLLPTTGITELNSMPPRQRHSITTFWLNTNLKRLGIWWHYEGKFFFWIWDMNFCDLSQKEERSILYQSASSIRGGWVYLSSLEKVQFGQWIKRLKSATSPENLQARHTSYAHWSGPTEMTAGQWRPVEAHNHVIINHYIPPPKRERVKEYVLLHCSASSHAPVSQLKETENSHVLKNSNCKSKIEQTHVPTHSQPRSSKVFTESLISSKIMTSIKLLEGLPWWHSDLRIRLPMQGTWVRALVREDPTCRGATKPVRHNYWVCALEPASRNYWSGHA